ncbi:aspartyl-tRNA synthetase [Seinonella peptonophila]|uniref:Aspartate--tRNA ligase n=1 Tax=Seinonella peptonophila TaxID=112248 RepID=A0A1M4WB68_9BACL|nr:aspartate--tRNA ligase [Seinonella peptonophila]SHE78333.1 aspartyl-tRNA synthetase [Seinonella peptonophila]
MGHHFRSHFTKQLTTETVGTQVTVNGWVQRRRDFGGLIFLDLRDHTGLVQVVFNPDISTEAIELASQARNEYVLSVTGTVVKRSPDTVNPKLTTGEIEIQGEQVYLFNPSKTPPFLIEDGTDVDETLRMKHRYLDLRRPQMQKNIKIRHRALQVVRQFLDQHGFLEIETPMLTKSTPEGARDYLVPSRLHEGTFYALPQSPQLFKQLLMVAGFERYFQITRCFRDEDLRADRQPEFTQIDIETSFMERTELQGIMEKMFQVLFQETIGVTVQAPFPRLTYHEAMERFGSDKPDLRFGLELIDLTETLQGTSFKVFASAIEKGGQVKTINVKGGANFTRKEIDAWGEIAQSLGAKGLAWITFKDGQPKGPIVKFLTPEELQAIQQVADVEAGDLLFFAADSKQNVARMLGEIRLRLGRTLNLIDEKQFQFVWITDFPLFEWNEETNRYDSMHHPFTMPRKEDIPLLGTDPGLVRAECDDLVLNGYELSSGSQRIYQREIQEKIFQVLQISETEASEKFGFLLEAFEYGAPPHGGVAFGFDRIMMILTGQQNLRETIAFPKTAQAYDPLTEAPAAVDADQLKELHIRLRK